MKKTIVAFFAAATLAVTAAAGAAPSSITLDQPDPHFGDLVTFTITGARTDRPWVNVRCYRDGVLLLDDWRAYFDGIISTLPHPTPLGPTGNWTEGGGDCVARFISLDHRNEHELATTEFSVLP